ncbi:MAG: hypothetical protein CSB34_02050 [Desulfobulbus propionicus]|nr:MAG: hypothetical protein CSB34_02050 [Desulfobulbus propionicus]PIE66511.1 MAG: hypothetical protein CSA26_00625 [Desulfobacterales bacterium]
MESAITSSYTTCSSSGGTSLPAGLYSQHVQQIAVSPSRDLSSEEPSAHTSQSADKVTLSPQAVARAAASGKEQTAKSSDQPSADEPATQLTPEEQQQVEELQARDREVRTHEQAHLSAAGQYAAGGPQYTYQKGPDGKRYAVGGEVQIDISEERTPEATIAKMQVVRKAALAPASPSAKDRQVAASATQKEAAARVAMQAEERAEASPVKGDRPENEDGTTSVEKTEAPPPPEEYTPFSATA